MKRIILVTGGQRSGKSSFSERLALGLSPNPVYIATAEVRDDEFRERVRIHQSHRGPCWTNIEEPRHLSRHDMTRRTVLIDCVTMWASRCFFDCGEDARATLDEMKKEFDAFTARDANFIFVSNEIGMGVIGGDPMTRRFTDLQGWINQYIASRADEVYLLVSGIPLKIK